MVPNFLFSEKIEIERRGFTVSAGAGTWPATLPNFLVALAKQLNRYGFEVS